MTEDIGMFDPLPSVSAANGHASGHVPNEDQLRYVAPVPDDAPAPPPPKGAQRYWYCDAVGHQLAAVDRREPQHTGKSKQFFPLTLWQDEFGAFTWRWKHPPAKRPLFGLTSLAQRPDAPVLVVEGEKAADAAAGTFPDHVSITSSGGSNTADLADWSPLLDRHVVIWPDNDEPGRKYATDVSRLAYEAGAASVRVVVVPNSWPVGWDLADPLPDGVSNETIKEMLKRVAPQSGPDMSIVLRTMAPAPEIPLIAFGPLAEWIEQAAECKSAPVDYVAISLLGAAAGVIGAARWVSPWEGWQEPAILWTLLVGSPSAGKSPAMDAVRDPLAVVERDAAASWPETRRIHDAAKVVAEARRDDWEADAREAVKNNRPAPPKPADADEPDEPQMPRVVINDATIEAVAAILAVMRAVSYYGRTSVRAGWAISESMATATAPSGSKLTGGVPISSIARSTPSHCGSITWPCR